MAKKALKTLDDNSGIQKSAQAKHRVQRLMYDEFVAHHYAYMVKVLIWRFYYLFDLLN
jgi:hypothetical protein